MISFTPHQAQVWFINSQSSDIENLKNILSSEEKKRSERFGSVQDQERFIIAHATLRNILGSILEKSPASLEFFINEHGKPFLSGESLQFNLSHSGDVFAIAIHDDKHVGVDIQQIRPIGSDALASRYFSSAEARMLADLEPDKKENEFYKLWTQKEALSKAKGEALAKNLRHSSDPDWSVVNIPAPPGYQAALAMSGEWSEPQIHLQDFLI